MWYEARQWCEECTKENGRQIFEFPLDIGKNYKFVCGQEQTKGTVPDFNVPHQLKHNFKISPVSLKNPNNNTLEDDYLEFSDKSSTLPTLLQDVSDVRMFLFLLFIYYLFISLFFFIHK
jgi:hypothetical protein